MTHNDLLRRVRYALNLNAAGISDICLLSGLEIKPTDVLRMLKKEDEPGFLACDDATLNYFLDGLITSRRGVRDAPSGTVRDTEPPLNNNLILRKLRIALELTDSNMIEVFRKAGIFISKAELSALFRAVDHRNYKECGDQLLRNFVRGLTLGVHRDQPE